MEGEHLDVSFHIDVGQVCCVLDDVSMITLIKRWRRTMLQYTPQLFKTVVEESCKWSPRNNVIPWYVVQ